MSVAGSFALNLVNVLTQALVTGTVNAGASGDVSISASSSSDTTTDAHAAQTPTDGTTSSLGLGASVALSLIDDVTTAGLTGTLGGGHNVALSASTIDLAHTNAKTGAAGGNVSIVPSVGITLSNVTTRAFVGAGTALSISGAFGATADQTASALTSAAGSADGSSAAIGLSLALTIANHISEATLARNLAAGGAVSLNANGSSDTSADATASATGAPADSTGGAAGNGVDGSIAAQRTFAESTSAAHDGSGSGSAGSTPSASTSKGGINVAAAVGVNLATTRSRATLIGSLTITSAGRFTLGTKADTDAHANASGGAVQPGGGGFTIAAGVAINKAAITNEAILPTGNTVSANGATIHALMASTHKLGAIALSGAGGGKLSIAGSVAIELENITTTASVAGTLNAGTGDVSIKAQSNGTSDVSALPLMQTTSTSSGEDFPFKVVSITDVSPSRSDEPTDRTARLVVARTTSPVRRTVRPSTQRRSSAASTSRWTAASTGSSCPVTFRSCMGRRGRPDDADPRLTRRPSTTAASRASPGST